MSICDLNSGVGRIQRATKELREAWLETRTHWDDQNAKVFEEKYLDSILPHIRLMVAELNEVRSSLEKAERECIDENRPTA